LHVDLQTLDIQELRKTPVRQSGIIGGRSLQKAIGRSCHEDCFSQFGALMRARSPHGSLFLLLSRRFFSDGLFCYRLLCDGLFSGRLFDGGFFCDWLFSRRLFLCCWFLSNCHLKSPLSHRGSGKCESFVNNSRCVVNKFSSRLRQRIFRIHLIFSGEIFHELSGRREVFRRARRFLRHSTIVPDPHNHRRGGLPRGR
jgi:hypothetical protein